RRGWVRICASASGWWRPCRSRPPANTAMSSAVFHFRPASIRQCQRSRPRKPEELPGHAHDCTMNPRKLLAAPFCYQLWRPRHARLIGRDLVGRWARPQYAHAQHLHAVIEWLCLAQDMRNNMPDAGGVSAGWSFEDGWLPSYPETSGYIVETFIAAARVLDRPDLLARAGRIIDWELSLQLADGAFP